MSQQEPAPLLPHLSWTSPLRLCPCSFWGSLPARLQPGLLWFKAGDFPRDLDLGLGALCLLETVGWDPKAQ